MALVRYNPRYSMTALERELNRIFDDLIIPENWENFSSSAKVPAAELTETEDNLHLKIEIPGMDAKDLDLQVMVDRVAISGERKQEKSSAEQGKTRSEFRYGKFERVIALPVKIQNTKVTAEYKDGILNLTLPKSDREKNKVVKVDLDKATA
ncbi:MAG: Hsp20/alpha crystallin family protein [Prochloraceae cyanobacterium]